MGSAACNGIVCYRPHACTVAAVGRAGVCVCAGMDAVRLPYDMCRKSPTSPSTSIPLPLTVADSGSASCIPIRPPSAGMWFFFFWVSAARRPPDPKHTPGGYMCTVISCTSVYIYAEDTGGKCVPFGEVEARQSTGRVHGHRGMALVPWLGRDDAD